MKNIRLYFSFLPALALLLAACASPQTSACDTVDGFVAALRAEGIEVEIAEQFSQEFFSVPAQRLVVNGDDIQVWAYADPASASTESSQITGAGYIIGLAMIDWIAQPHFFQCGKLIVLYLGEDQETLATLQSLLGPQLAAE
ncbi:MAG: hypothetical protein WD751_09200 [Anaerolineales bacterium]